MCTSNCEVKSQIAELLTMLEPIWTKLNQLKKLYPDEISSVSSDKADKSANSRTEPMDETPSPTQAQQQISDNVSNSGLPLGDLQNVNISRRNKSKRPRLDSEELNSSDEEQSDTSPLCKLVFSRDASGNCGQNGANSKPVDTILMRSVYLTEFLPTTEPADIINHLNSIETVRPLTSDFKITKLVKKDNKMELSFVSFKLDVPRQHFDKVIAAGIWPKKIKATEFQVKSMKSSAPANRPKTHDNQQIRSQLQNLSAKAAHINSKNSIGTVKTQRLEPAMNVSNRHCNKRPLQRPRRGRRQRNQPNCVKRAVVSNVSLNPS
ncbi:uncharacterized protein LOC129572038 [Sitodiplosis mosellana]|uniref:uncharacterized protein LOC129572038 n=1 Tax=Sitodiplosis mosellana TaxID=263140 RepID=UPI00244510F6|nr:uncharacterized protein LOC129572038 [Sitodiplosis mosellana]XP_055307916.1 uncharacterized protein LOC129572038 [Sitodiplosis mosellana]XP_055307917.1 uncharacterized protein LOC129572038 [Sitodiplosis mosellana]XP_055307918.1 uncharacterized protein LOC129572038 [Sitodiplosis mosellana]